MYIITQVFLTLNFKITMKLKTHLARLLTTLPQILKDLKKMKSYEKMRHLTFQIMLKHNTILCNKMRKNTKLFTLMLLTKFSRQQKPMIDNQHTISIEEIFIKNQASMNRRMKVMTKPLAQSQKMPDTCIKKDLLMSFKIKKVSKTLFKCTKEHYKLIKITLLLVFILGKCFIKTWILMMRYSVSQLSFKIQTYKISMKYFLNEVLCIRTWVTINLQLKILTNQFVNDQHLTLIIIEDFQN